MAKEKKEKIEYSEILQRIQHSDPSLFKAWAESENLLALPHDPQEFLDVILGRAKDCTNCLLSTRRTQVVLPEGKASAKIMLVSQGPGAVEDLTGIPFSGPLELKNSRCGKCTSSGVCYQTKLLNSPTDWGKKPKAVTCDPKLVS